MARNSSNRKKKDTAPVEDEYAGLGPNNKVMKVIVIVVSGAVILGLVLSMAPMMTY